MQHSNSRKIALAALIGAISLPCFAAESAAQSGAQSVDAAWVEAMQANDIEAVMKVYAQDAVAWFPDEKEARGDTAIRAAYQGLLSANTVVAASESDTSYRTMGKTSIGWGKFSLTLKPKAGGAPVVMVGRFSEVVERRDGHWVYIVDHASAEPAMAMAEPAKQ
jgi:ketosteroid isomerase-like protein